ncbi:MAG TPA: S1-like domain-containing RNA-binding protein [Lachnospiraceae bacterium]|nr:S1-like domain-containing RNA-binding protein [Lachnospiraceae bacterium]
MIELGKKQKLTVVKLEDFGVYLGESRAAGHDERVLLPIKMVPEGIQAGDEITVFIYKDSSDRLIATTAEPKILLHGVARLNVREVTKIGAFLDWGLEKDLFLPFHEQTKKAAAGDSVLVALYVDKSERLAATMKLYPYLRQDPPYKVGDTVSGTVYQLAANFGVFIAVDDMYSGMIPKREVTDFQPGDKVTVRVTNVKEDGKLDLSAGRKAYLQLGTDAEAVLEKIREDYKGELPFDDKADPEAIHEAFGLSKAAFKRAVGHLYKEHQVNIGDGKIKAL